MANECASHCQHLPLPPGEVAGDGAFSLLERGEQLEHFGQPVACSRPLCRRGHRSLKVFRDRQRLENLFPLRNQDHAAAHHLVRRQAVKTLAVEPDAPVGNLLRVAREQAGDGVEGRTLSAAVNADQRDNAPLRHLQRHPADGSDRFVVDRFEILDVKPGHHCSGRYLKGQSSK